MPPTPTSLPAAPIGHLHLDLTDHCNFRCEFCFHYRELTARRGFMDTGLALRLIDEAADRGLARGVAMAVFGEALLHPDVFPIAEHAVRRGLEVTLNTKGGLLDQATSRRIVDSGIHKLIISLNTPDAEAHRVNHGPAGMSWDDLLGRIRSALRARLERPGPLHIYLYLMNTAFARPRGLAFLEDDRAARAALAYWHGVAAELARELGQPEPAPLARLADGRLVRRKWPIDRGIELLPGIELVLKEAHLWGNRLLDPNLEAVPTRRGFCALPWTMLTVHWEGSCSLCCLDYNRDLVIGNVTGSTLAEVFAGERIERVRAGFAAGRVEEPLCQTCLGGIRDRRDGKMVRLPQVSAWARARNGLRKYGLIETARYGIRAARERLAGGRPGQP